MCWTHLLLVTQESRGKQYGVTHLATCSYIPVVSDLFLSVGGGGDVYIHYLISVPHSDSIYQYSHIVMFSSIAVS